MSQMKMLDHVSVIVGDKGRAKTYWMPKSAKEIEWRSRPCPVRRQRSYKIPKTWLAGVEAFEGVKKRLEASGPEL